MPGKSLSRALKGLDVYHEKRDLPNSFASSTSDFDMLASIPGLFDPEVILKEVKILDNLYPHLVPGLIPNLKSVLAEDKYEELQAVYSNRKESELESLEEWESIEPIIEKYCPQILPFLAKTVRLDIPSTSKIKDELCREVYSTSTIKCIRINLIEQDYIQCAALSNTHVLAGSSLGMIYSAPLDQNDTFDVVRLYEVSELKKSEWQIHKWPIQDMRYTNVDDLLISCDTIGGIRLWSSSNFKRLAKFDVRNTPVWSLAVPDNTEQKMFASSHEDGTARLFYYDRPECLRMFVHSAPVKCIAFHGRLIATATFIEKCLRVWNIDLGNQIRLIDGFDSVITDLKFINSSRIIAVTCLGTFYVAEISNSAIIASKVIDFQSKEVCSLVTRVSENLVAIAGTYGSLFFITMGLDNNIEIIKNLPNKKSLNLPLLTVDWNNSSSCFWGIYA